MNQVRETVVRPQPRTEHLTVRPESDGRRHTARPIRVVVISRQRLIREALSAPLGAEEDIEVIGAADQESRAFELVRDLEPDVVVIDIATRGLGSVQFLRMILHDHPKAKLLVLTSAGDEALIYGALSAGARGYVSNEAGISDLRKAIRGVHDGDVWVERRILLQWLRGDVPELAGTEPQRTTKAVLTVREREILRHLASGGTNKQIARALLITDKTVKTHLQHIFRKLQVTRRLEAVLYAIRQGLR